MVTVNQPGSVGLGIVMLTSDASGDPATGGVNCRHANHNVEEAE